MFFGGEGWMGSLEDHFSKNTILMNCVEEAHVSQKEGGGYHNYLLCLVHMMISH